MQLVLGSRRYSSWSLRGWLAVRVAGLAVEEIVVPLADGVTAELARYSPTGLVPVLRDDALVIWDSLAIAEYCAEQCPTLWPAEPRQRAVARSIAAEMHAGFAALRRELPMSLDRAPVTRALSDAAAQDVRRIESIWQACLARGGMFLFGDAPTVPDIMFAPVVTRFLTYSVPVSDSANAYCRTIRAWHLVEQWYQSAKSEPEAWRLAKYE